MHPILQRSYELQAQLEQDELDQVGAFAPRQAVSDEPFGADAMTPQDFIGKKVDEMSGAEFSRWCDLGKPLLKAPEPEPSQDSGPDWLAIDRLIADHVRDHGLMIADAIGAEVGEIEKRIRSFVNEQCGLLRAELATLRGTVKAANEIAELRREVESLQRATAIDVPSLPMRSAWAKHEH